MTASTVKATTERYLALVRDEILSRADLKPEERDKLAASRLLYGLGNGTYRGVTVFSAWKSGDAGPSDLIEIAATAQESWVQLAGTLLHELGHSLAGMDAGHSRDWKDATLRLGFRIRPAAAGQRYCLAMFTPALRLAVYRAAEAVADGTPTFATAAALPRSGAPRPCRAGQGTRGGRSRGPGSGSRLRLWECECERPVKVRVASDDFRAHCDVCEAAFTRKD